MNVDIGNLAGANGGIYIGDTTANTGGDWFAIYCVADAVFSTLTSNITDLPDDLALSAGQAVYGVFSAITLASGTIVAYNR